ncbi:hypothetical protein ACYTFC_10175 [Streptomyces globosus]
MSQQDELDAVRRSLDELARKVEQLERRTAPQPPERTRPAAAQPLPMVTIPDAPYDSALWTDSDDEGLGARGRRAP